MENKRPVLRHPTVDDGAQIHQLIEQCPPLDLNSTYLYLLQCTHFANTCLVAEIDGEVAGFVSGYIKPGAPDTYFLWQVAVGQALRGQGMARKMIDAVLDRPECQGIKHLETTITPDNEASWALFKAFARDRKAGLEGETFFTTEQLGGEHSPEQLVRIGPFGAFG